MSKHNTPLILIDGSSYLFRAYYALPPLTNSKQMPTGAIYGVMNMLRKLMSEYQPTHIAVVFDPKGKTARHHMFPAYKANRTEMPDDLAIQIPLLHEFIKAYGLPLIIKSGVEADDIIATLAEQAAKKNQSVLISTGDKDLAQLVNERVTLINTMTNQMLNRDGVYAKFGVWPEQIIDYLALTGDSVDNIPGIPQVGPKTAVKWLQQYGTIQNLIQHAHEITGKVGENLRAHLTELPLSEKLVTVDKNIELNEAVEALVPLAPNKSRLAELCLELEFKNWLKEFQANVPAPVTIAKEANYSCLLDQAAFLTWIDKLKAHETFAFDTETTHWEPMQADLVGISFAVNAHEAAYVPLAHDYENAPPQLSKQWVLEQLKPILTDKNKTLIGQNIKYDYEIMVNNGIQLQNKFWDTLLSSYVLNNTQIRHDMDTLAQHYLSHKTVTFEEIAGTGVKQLTFNQIPLEVASHYAAEDADVTWQLRQKMQPLLDENPASKSVFENIEMPLMPVLARMELHGVLIDVEQLKQQSAQLATQIDALEKQAYQLAGREFNLGSPKQLQEILYNELKIPVLKKTPSGQPSTAEDILQDLALSYDLPKIILEYRSLSKLKSTYTDRLPEQINARTGRVHTSYNQAVTATGRLSSNNPNLQNIPIRTEAGRKIRQAFIAPPGSQLISADYSQIELRIMAHWSEDPGLLASFASGLDIHSATAAELFGIAPTDVDSNQRRFAKVINFGLLYGMSAFGLAKQLGIERSEAQHYINRYFQRYPAVHNYMEKIRKLAAKQGYVETLAGRRLFVSEINSKNAMRRQAAERAAINAPMQGTAADIIKIAMIRLDQWLRTSKINAHMVMQVHDELIFEAADSVVDEVVAQVREQMENAVKLHVPILVEIGVGPHWDAAH